MRAPLWICYLFISSCIIPPKSTPDPSWRAWHDEEPIRLKISSCLLGARVRFDDGHKRGRYRTDVLGELFDCGPVWPDVDSNDLMWRLDLEPHSRELMLHNPVRHTARLRGIMRRP